MSLALKMGFLYCYMTGLMVLCVVKRSFPIMNKFNVFLKELFALKGFCYCYMTRKKQLRLWLKWFYMMIMFNNVLQNSLKKTSERFSVKSGASQGQQVHYYYPRRPLKVTWAEGFFGFLRVSVSLYSNIFLTEPLNQFF